MQLMKNWGDFSWKPVDPDFSFFDPPHWRRICSLGALYSIIMAPLAPFILAALFLSSFLFIIRSPIYIALMKAAQELAIFRSWNALLGLVNF